MSKELTKEETKDMNKYPKKVLEYGNRLIFIKTREIRESISRLENCEENEFMKLKDVETVYGLEVAIETINDAVDLLEDLNDETTDAYRKLKGLE